MYHTLRDRNTSSKDLRNKVYCSFLSRIVWKTSFFILIKKLCVCFSIKYSTRENNRYTYIHTVGEKKDSTKRNLWSKTTLITSSVGGARVHPPLRKMNTFFLRSLALGMPIYGNFQSNGVNWRSIKRWTKKFI